MKKQGTFLLLLLSVMLLFCVSCEDGSASSTEETISYQSNETILDEDEATYVNVYKLHDIDEIIGHARLYEDEFRVVTKAADGPPQIRIYDRNAELLRSELLQVTDWMHVNFTDDKKLINIKRGPQYGWKVVGIYESDGTCVAESPKVREIKAQTVKTGINAFGDDIFYYGDYTLHFFDTIETAPVEYEMPCLVSRITPYENGTYLLYGQRGEVLDSERRLYLFDPAAGTFEEFRYPGTDCTPKELFPDALDVFYQNGTLYANCKTGIYVYRDGVPTELINWEESFLDASGMELMEILSDSCFYVDSFNFMDRDMRRQFLKPTPERFTKPREIVRIATIGLDIKHRELLNASVLQFNTGNRQYKVELTDYEDGASYYLSIKKAEAEKERIQGLFEADLLAGITYDAYFFPQTSENRVLLADKGLLSDLTPYIGEDQIHGCVKSAYTINGEMIAMPFFLRLSTLTTSEDTLPAQTQLTYDILRDIAQNLADDETLFATELYENLKLTGVYDFLDEDAKTSSFDSPAFTEFLEFLLQIKDGQYTDTSMEIVHDFSFGTSFTGAPGIDYHAFVLLSRKALDNKQQERIRFAECHLNSMESLAMMLLLYDGREINYCGYPSEQGPTVVLSSDAVYSISTTAASPDGAAAFMQYWLSEEVQTSSAATHFGLPVSKAAMEKQFPIGTIVYKSGIKNGKVVPFDWLEMYPKSYQICHDVNPSPTNAHGFATIITDTEDRARFMDFLDRATIRTTADATLGAIIDEEISFAEGGARSAAETGKILQSRVSIYINE